MPVFHNHNVTLAWQVYCMASHQGLRTGLDPFEQFQSLFPGDCGIKKLGKKKKREREIILNLMLLP